MFLTIAVGIYSSRLFLEALGVVDYGIYSVVGGVVTSMLLWSMPLSVSSTFIWARAMT